MPAADVVPGTRQRLIASMTDLLRRRGLHGIGLTELLQAAQAPKGVLYHHFPGGKTELAAAAIDAAADAMDARLDALLRSERDLPAALRTWLASAQRQLERSDFEAGCPLAAVALESVPADTLLRQALSRAFGVLRARLAAGLVDAGLPAARASALGTLLVAAYEGSLMQARVAGHAQALAATTDTLLGLVERELREAAA